jgi:hypothetical protein
LQVHGSDCQLRVELIDCVEPVIVEPTDCMCS